MLEMFEKVVDMNKALDSLIEELIDNRDIKDTIIYLKPKDEKKDNILKLVQVEVEKGNISVLEGFRNTVSMLEEEFA